MRTLLAASLLLLMATVAVAQNTTGSLSQSPPVVRAQAAAPAAATPAPTTTTTPGVPTATPTTPPATTAAPTTPTDTTNGGTILPNARDAAIVMCGQDFTTGGGALLVFSASVSANGPAVAPGTACAQALADLFAAGFGVIDVQPFNQQLQYSLVR
jgi:hypothetical protein